MASDKMDPGQIETEKILKQLENRIRKEYKQATEEMQDKIDDYWARYTLKDKKWQEWVQDGTKTAKEYQMWQQQQLMVGKSWESLKTSLAEDMVHADDVAKAMTKSTMPNVYAENFNYGTFSIEKAAKIDTSFTLYDQSTVTRILKDNPDLLPAPGKKVSREIAEGKAMRWNKQQIQSVMTQGILQGESIPKLSKRLATTVGERNYKSAIRNARTMTTGAQNAGRMDSYKRAEEKGIDLEVEWIATLDNRTRHEHRMLDGQTRPVGEPFEVHGIKIDYAGDPNAPARMIYNCRCTLAGHVKGFNAAEVERDTSGIGGMSYNDWKKQKRSDSNPIDLPEQKGKAIAEKYKKEYNKTNKKPIEQVEMFSKKSEFDSENNYISDERFDKLTIKARKLGANILRGTDEVEAHLDFVEANASTIDDTILFRKNVTISDVLEETFHFEQNINHVNNDKPAELRTILNEIEAKEYLIKNADKYKIPRNEIEKTKKQLESYKNDLENYRGE